MPKSVSNFIIPFLALLVMTGLPAFAFDEFRTYRAGLWDLEVDLNYFNATSNFADDGDSVNLVDPNSYTLLNLDMGARWTPTNRWGVFSQATYAMANSENNLASRSNSGISQLLLGADFVMLKKKSFDIVPEATLIIPMIRPDPNSDNVSISEGAMEVSGRVIARGQFGIFQPMGFLGLTYRDEGRSALLPYGVGAEAQFTGITVGGELRGYQSITDDDHTNNILAREYPVIRNGGSLKFNSVNPSLLETNFWLRLSPAYNWGLKLGGGTTLMGSNAGGGWNVFSVVNYQIQSQTASKRQSAPVEQFEQQFDDGVDQDLFKAPPPPTPTPTPRPPSPAVQRKKMQQELDQTEMQIELRSNKNRSR